MQKEAALKRPQEINFAPRPAGRVPRKVLAFHVAAAQGEVKCIEGLMGAEQVRPDAKDRVGNTALMHAAMNGKEFAVGHLLEKGASANLANKEGITALMFAAANGHEGTVRILLGHRAKAYLKDSKGKAAMDYARENGHPKIASLIQKSLETLNKALSKARKEGKAGEEAYYLCHGADPSSI